MQRGGPAVPDVVFPAETGGPIHHANLERAWLRLRRRAQESGIRPLKLHSTRHTYASLALASGKSVRWVADQLGHSTPMLTLRIYAHAMREEEADLGFADFGRDTRQTVSGPPPSTQKGAVGVANRRYPSPRSGDDTIKDDAPGTSVRGRSGILEHETGFEPATSTLATWCSTN